MRPRLIVLILCISFTQSMTAQLTSLGLVEESNIEKEIPNGITRGYFHFIPELRFVGEKELYAGTPHGLYKCNISKPEAAEWEKLPITDDIVEDFEVRGDTVVVLSRKELLLSVDRGMTVESRFSDTVFLDTAGYIVRELHNIAMHPHDAKRIHVAHQADCISYTSDFGKSWTRIEGRGLTDLYYSPHDPMLLLGYDNNKHYSSAGVYVSSDGGIEWTYARDATEQMGEIYRIAFHPTDRDKLITCGNGVYALSDNGGATWNKVYSDEQWRHPAAWLFDVVYDVYKPDILYGANQCTYDGSFKEDIDVIRVMRSIDGGFTWSEFYVKAMDNGGRLLRLDIANNHLALYTSAGGIYLLDVDAVDTAISPVVNGEGTAPYYDLMGRKVARPTRGIYIREGRKVVIE